MSSLCEFFLTQTLGAPNKSPAPSRGVPCSRSIPSSPPNLPGLIKLFPSPRCSPQPSCSSFLRDALPPCKAQLQVQRPLPLQRLALPPCPSTLPTPPSRRGRPFSSLSPASPPIPPASGPLPVLPSFLQSETKSFRAGKQAMRPFRWPVETRPLKPSLKSFRKPSPGPSKSPAEEPTRETGTAATQPRPRSPSTPTDPSPSRIPSSPAAAPSSKSAA